MAVYLHSQGAALDTKNRNGRTPLDIASRRMRALLTGDEQIERFAQVVLKAGYPSPVRTPRGRDILAACGQLKSESRKQTRRELRAEAAE